MGDNVRQCAALEELHDHPELVLHQEGVVHLDDVRVVVVAHDDHLVEEQLPALLLPQVHLLHRHLALGVAVVGDADDARRALANLQEVVEKGSA